MKKLIAMLTVAVLISLGTLAYAAGDGKVQKESLTVNNWKGQHIGTVNYVVVNSSTGSITFVILYLDKERRKEIAVPLASFASYDHGNGILTLNVSEKELALAPEFHDSDLDNPAFAENVYRFFGLAPSWTEEGGEKRM